MKEPKIRFNEFKGEWEETTIGHLFSFKNGLNKGKEFFGHGTPIINYTDVYKNRILSKSLVKGTVKLDFDEISRYRVLKGDVFFTRTSETPEEVGLSSVLVEDIKDCSFSGFVLRARPTTDNLVPEFCSQCFSVDSIRNAIKSTCTYTTRALTNGTVLSKINLCYPIKAEQHSIASFFTTLDAQISASTSRLASLKQIKAASLQAMFPQEGETVPKLRFKGFEGEWEKVKLNTFAKRVTRKNTHLESTLALTISSTQGLVSQIEYFNNLVIGSNISNYYLLKKGEFDYNKSYSNGYPYGSVKRLDRYEKGILSTLYITFCIDDSISSDYLTRFFDTTLWHKEVAEKSAEGARNHGLLNIGVEDFLIINIVRPQSKEEQQMISDYFTNLDRQITLQSQRLEKLKQIKAACLDKMFV